MALQSTPADRRILTVVEFAAAAVAVVVVVVAEFAMVRSCWRFRENPQVKLTCSFDAIELWLSLIY